MSYFTNQDFHAALTAFDSAIELSATDTSSERTAQYLFAKGVTLGKLDKPEDAIAVYNKVDKRFGADRTPTVHEQVVKGLNGAGLNRILLAKQMWQDAATKKRTPERCRCWITACLSAMR